jgi:NAD(P)-dependent dehydrogenase (short-subunit alcohol dehydrogenase family)
MSQEKVVLVTGVSSGIGRTIAAVLASRGFRVFGTTRRSGEPGRQLSDVELVRLDVRDEESVRSCVKTVLDKAGRIDALINNAGYTLIGALEETTIDEAKQLFETNFFGAMRMTQAVLRSMRERRSGRIINIGSVVGFVPAPYQGIYCASKHALEGYSESLDHEVRQFGIRVSVIEPGFTRTNIAQNSQMACPLSKRRALVK